MPDRGAVDAVEPRLDPGQRADHDQRHREEQNRLRSEHLADMAAPRLTCWSHGDPEHGLKADKRHHRERAEVAVCRSQHGEQSVPNPRTRGERTRLRDHDLTLRLLAMADNRHLSTNPASEATEPFHRVTPVASLLCPRCSRYANSAFAGLGLS